MTLKSFRFHWASGMTPTKLQMISNCNSDTLCSLRVGDLIIVTEHKFEYIEGRHSQTKNKVIILGDDEAKHFRIYNQHKAAPSKALQ